MSVKYIHLYLIGFITISITMTKTTATVLSHLPSHWAINLNCSSYLMTFSQWSSRSSNMIWPMYIEKSLVWTSLFPNRLPRCISLPSFLIFPDPFMVTRCHTFKNPFPSILLDSTPLEENLKSASLGKSFPINRDLLCHLHHSLPPNQA